jgi:hypothetical protein
MDFKLRNKLSIISAVLLSILQIILLKEFFQAGLSALFCMSNSSFNFSFPYFAYYFEPEGDASILELTLLYFAPYIYLVLSVEVASILIKKIPQGAGRFFLVVFILLQIGYLLVHIFYSAVILILNPGIENDWIALSLYLGLGDIERFIFAFGVIFLFVFYLNMSTKRIMQYINY